MRVGEASPGGAGGGAAKGPPGKLVSFFFEGEYGAAAERGPPKMPPKMLGMFLPDGAFWPPPAATT